MKRDRSTYSTLRYRQGLTLIELMVTLAILAIVLMVGFPEVATAIRNSQMRSAVEVMSTALQTARNEAVKRNLPVVASYRATDVTVTFTDTNPSSPNVGQVTTILPATPYGTNINPIPVVDITFNALGQATDSLGVLTGVPATNYVFSPTHIAGTCETVGGTIRCLNIVLQRSGQSRVCDPKLIFANDPRGC